jgi:hypothetical protein
MRFFLTAAGVGSLLLIMTGCTASPVVGTWTGRGSGGEEFTFGSVSFVGDRTFTAEAKYGGQSRMQSGTWSTDGNRLMLKAGDTDRNYTYKMEDGDLVVTDPKSNRSITLERLRG